MPIAAADPADLVRSLEAYIAALDIDAVGHDIAGRYEIAAADAVRDLAMYCNEAVATLRMVAAVLPRPPARILEVGSGIGVCANFLASHGFEVTELEPSGLGFGFIEAARSALGTVMERPAKHLDIDVDRLDPAQHGMFDLVYSFNVIEHVPDWASALDKILAVLTPDGRTVNSCPNYSVPYEPHFGVPLVPGRPALTARVLPERIAGSDLWASLNWITARGVRRWATRRAVRVHFETGQIGDALERLSTDPDFRARHPGMVATAARLLRRLRLIALIRRLPAGLSTPMCFEVCRPR